MGIFSLCGCLVTRVIATFSEQPTLFSILLCLFISPVFNDLICLTFLQHILTSNHNTRFEKVDNGCVNRIEYRTEGSSDDSVTCVCVRACVCVCVRACVRACVCVCGH